MKQIAVKAIPKRLATVYFHGTEKDIAEFEKLENERFSAFESVFNAIMAGGASVAYWDNKPVKSVTGKTIVSRKILHPSTRCDGLQLSTLSIENGKEIPVMHQTFETWEKSRFMREHGNLYSDYIINVF